MNNFTCWLAWFEKYDFLLQDPFIQSHKHKTTLTRAPKLAAIITYLYDGSTCSKCNVTIYKRYESFVKIIGLLRNWCCFSLWILSLFTQEHISGMHTAFKFYSRSHWLNLWSFDWVRFELCDPVQWIRAYCWELWT